MALSFKSIRSGSSGNCLMLWTEQTRVLIDCGVPAQYRCRDLLLRNAGHPHDIDAVLVTHAHGDHIRYDALRVLGDFRIPVYCHEGCLGQIYDKHAADCCEGLTVRTFSDRRFTVKDFEIEPFRVSHHPAFLTHGFVIRCTQEGRRRKIVIVTDFNDYSGLVDHFSGADFIFVEANHDPELLRQNPNPNSAFHMKNETTGWLLAHALVGSDRSPEAIMLGHLSEQRNSEEIALATVQDVLRQECVDSAFDLRVAPRDEVSGTVTIVP